MIKICHQIKLLKTIKMKTTLIFAWLLATRIQEQKSLLFDILIKLLEQKLEEQLIECLKDYKMNY